MPSNLIKVAKEQLREKILESIGVCITSERLPTQPVKNFTIEIPSNILFGDLATNVAMVCSKSFKMPPLQIAQIIAENINLEDTYFDSYNIVSPGFINFFFKQCWFKDVLTNIDISKQDYGKSNIGKNQKVMVEFVSANPTGPMHMGNARGGALGDCLASVLELCGYDVIREFYINDAGNQIEKFGSSLEARYLQIFKGDEISFPEDGYHGDDIKDLAELFAKIYKDEFVEKSSEDRKKALVDFALPKNISKIKEDLKKYRIEYDVWFKESTLYKNKDVDKVIELLKNNNCVYEKEGAIWYKATSHGSKKDEVLIRANGFPTYFATDIAYHYNKFINRKFNKVINIWGADHHGHVERLKDALQDIGIDSSKLDIILMQLVRLTKNGNVVRMSKRTGKSITLTDLLEEVPIDAARFFFNMREANSHLDFDLGLAVEQSSQNPVYYVQYAYARICSVLSKAKYKEEFVYENKVSDDDFICETSEEKELVKILSLYPDVVEEASKTYDSSSITKYSLSLAAAFHKFYNSCKVVSEDERITNIRLLVCSCTKIVLKNVLSLIKIDAPEKM